MGIGKTEEEEEEDDDELEDGNKDEYTQESDSFIPPVNSACLTLNPRGEREGARIFLNTLTHYKFTT